MSRDPNRLRTDGVDDTDRRLRSATGRTSPPMTIDSTFLEHLEETLDDTDRELVASVPMPADSVSVHRLPHRDEVTTLDLERFLDAPRRGRGNATVHDPVDFAAYVNRVRTSSTTVWADQAATRVTAVVNDATDQAAGEIGSPSGADHGWRDLTVALELQVDPEWSAWLDLDGSLTDQETMAEHFEAYGPNVVRPDAATMLEVASSLHGTKTAEFESSRRDRTGDIVVRYAETTNARAGQRDDLEVPERFTVRIAPYVGFEPVELEALVRIRVNGGSLSIGYRLVRPDLVLRAAFERVRTTIVEHLDDDVPVLLGTAPTARTSSVPTAPTSRG